jgi:hypothetical protein
MHQTPTHEGVYLLDGNQCGATRIMVIHNNFQIDRKIDASFKFLPYQLWMVGYWPTMALTGNGEFRRGSLRNGYHIQGRQQARKLPNPDTGR